MTHISTHAFPATSLLQRSFAAASSFLGALGRALTVNRECEARLRRIRTLQAKSDAELAGKGLTRDRIVHYVFRDIYYI